MLRELRETPEFEFDKMSDVDKIALEISIFFHDIIYRPDLETNEEDSVKFAEAFIKEIWGNEHEESKHEVLAKVKSAILSTRTHHGTSHIEKVLSELDMSILDSPLDKYQTYAFNVEREFRPLHKNAYPKGRIEFLEKGLTGYKYNWRKGENVESNIKWEISHWKSQIGEQ